MNQVQRSTSDAVWTLGPGASTTLTVAQPRVLQACEGRLWVTTEGNAQDAALDVWLLPGDTVTLDRGTRIVIEGWPQARFRLLVPPPARALAAPSWRTRVAQAWSRVHARSPGLRLGT